MTEDQNHERGILYRGTMLDTCINLERWVETFLVVYFTGGGDQGILFMELIISKMTFDTKIATIEVLLEKAMGKDYDKTYSKLISELRLIKTERNKFAHYSQEITEKKEIVLLDYVGKKKTFTYTKGTYENWLKRIERCTEEIMKMIKSVPDNTDLPAE